MFKSTNFLLAPISTPAGKIQTGNLRHAVSPSPASKPFSQPETKTEFAYQNPIQKILQSFQLNPVNVQTSEGRKKACERLLGFLKEHNPDTVSHSRQVAGIASQFAKSMGLAPKDVEEIETASLLHDIGKMFTPKNVLNKPGKLIDKEKVIMDQHASQGQELIEQLGLTKNGFFKNVAALVGNHHSSSGGFPWFGKLKEKEVIIGLADVYNALTIKRSYKSSFSPQEALETMKRMQKEKQKWDPVIFKKFQGFVEENYIHAGNNKGTNKSPAMENPFKQSLNAPVNIFALNPQPASPG